MTVDINTILSGLTVVVLAILALLQAGAKRGLERSAELFVNNANWSRELAQQLERARGLGRQEARLDSYGALWKELRTLAIYDTASIDRTAIADLSSRLSDWYFSPKGGLLLTEHVREFYFALQDLLQAAVRYPDAPVDRPPSGEPRERLLAIVRADHLDGAEQTLVALKDLPAREWQAVAAALGQKWRADIRTLTAHWPDLAATDRFVVLQQVSSALRTTMANDIETRMP